MTDNETYGPLTLGQATRLAMVLSTAQRCAIVARLVDGHVFAGQARSVSNADGSLSTGDVRGAFLRVTLDGGSDAYWPILDLIDEVRSGYFVPDYKGPSWHVRANGDSGSVTP